MPAIHYPARHRFTVATPAGDAELAYLPGPDGTLDLQHTFVPPAARGGTAASDLVRAAVAHAREQQVKLIATCPYVQQWLVRHPDQQDIFLP